MNQPTISLHANRPATRHSKTMTRLPFHVAVFYEDYVSGKSAIKLYDRLLRNFENDFTPTINLWRFDVLHLMFLKELTVDDAAKADLIVFATHADFQLSPFLKAWTDVWLSQKLNQESALAVLVGPSERADEGTPQIQAYYRGVAQRGGMEFFENKLSFRGQENTFPGLVDDVPWHVDAVRGCDDRI
jgi:hypothetical protein